MILQISLILFLYVVHKTKAAIRITEFLASNDEGLTDFEGDNEDWIEIFNDGASDVNLGSYSLTDDDGDIAKWTFPSVVIPANSFLIVFASDKADDDTGTELHTNFKLSAGGEYLGLYDDAGTLLSAFSPEYPPQTTDQSFGINADGDAVYFPTPTPGAANGLSLAPSVTFSHERGFYTAALTLELTQTSTNTEIRYTLDGSTPSATNGQVYSSPFVIATTTVVRAASFGGAQYTAETNVPTHSFIFLNDVLQQGANIPGFPDGIILAVGPDNDGAVPRAPLDFAMDPAVVSEYSDEIISAMQAIPTMALTASVEDIFGDDGFYFGEDIEKMASMEILDGSNTDHLFVGVESHSHKRLKRSLRLNFRTSYGYREWETDLFRDYPLNGESATDKLRRIVLRSGNNRSWARNQEPDATSYTIDQFYRDTQVAMSGFGSHGTFVHLYLNGVYEGVYNAVERPDDTFGEAYFGGDDDDWFFTNHGGAGSKDDSRWDYLLNDLVSRDMKNDGNYAELQEYLDVEAFADYLILNFYFGMTDWPNNNWYVIARNEGSGDGPLPAKFVCWDGEQSLDRRQHRSRQGATIQQRFLWKTPYKNEILNLWHSLRRRRGFMEMFYNRVEMHTAPGGALSVESATGRWDAINSFVESAIIGESARWGDSLEGLGGKYAVTRTRDVDFFNQVAKIRALLQGNTQQFLDEVDRLDDCDSFLSGLYCSLMTLKFWLAEILGFMSWFYR